MWNGQTDRWPPAPENEPPSPVFPHEGQARGSRCLERPSGHAPASLLLTRSIPVCALFDRWHEHRDRDARDQLVERFMPLARKLARRYRMTNEPLEDLLQVASFGLFRAIERFDPGRGTAFSSFAVPTILGELKRYLRDCGWSVHVPRGLQELAQKVSHTAQQLSATAGRSPTVQDLAQYLEVSVEDVIDAMGVAQAHRAASLDAPVGDADGESVTLAETIGEDDPGFETVDASVTIAQAARSLSERDRQVIADYFLRERTQEQIAKSIGVSQMQVSRILRRSIERLSEQTSPAR